LIENMQRILRGLSVAVLALSVANPLAALCLCHQVQNPAAREHACCHEVAPTGQTFSGVPACCHTDQADHGAARLDSPQLALDSSMLAPRQVEPSRPATLTLLAHAFVPFHRLTVLRT
jgi:hypothetical protein